MKNIVFAPVRSGNHFILRSISKSLKIPYAVFLHPEHLKDQIVNHEKYIVSLHKEKDLDFLNEIGNDINCLGIYRNPLDHALSMLRYYRIKIDPNSSEFIDWIKDDFYQEQRNIIKSLDGLFLINYDSLMSNNLKDKENHINEIKDFFNADQIVLENIAKTKAEHGNGIAQLGVSGRWRDIISQESWHNIVNEIDEPLNEYWNHPSLVLSKDDGFNNFKYDFEEGYK